MSPVSRSATEPLHSLRQEIAELAALPDVQAAVEWFREQAAEFTRWQLELAEISAPPFGEAKRAEWLSSRFKEIGLEQVSTDKVGNVLGVLASSTMPAVSISAHIDTVFPAGTVLNPRQQRQKLYGPGISDNAAGVTALLALALACHRFGLPHSAPLLFIANVGEEGEGDLRGMRHIFYESEWKNKIAASLVIDGAGTDTIIADALGSRRFEIIVQGPGGHSWTDFGAPNPIVAISRAIALFSETRVPSSPKTTFNVGVISGGTSVNSIPESASMRVDIRSSSAFEIERLELELRSAVKQAVQEEDNGADTGGSPDRELEAVIKVIGNRPAGELDRKSRILQLARAVDSYLGNSAQLQRASTDANIPISLGREAVAIGAGGHGGGAHTLQEWFDPAGRELGLQRGLLLVLALAAGDSKGMTG
jgi:acetylornithine deacetylase/succinyl-diaminopimelate desuccinylase-like protein